MLVATLSTVCVMAKAKIVTVVEFDNGQKIGGYALASWTASTPTYAEGSGSFLFSLDNQWKATLIHKAHQFYSSSTYGPTFGGGHDLYINSEMTNGYCNLNHTYTGRVGGYSSNQS